MHPEARGAVSGRPVIGYRWGLLVGLTLLGGICPLALGAGASETGGYERSSSGYGQTPGSGYQGPGYPGSPYGASPSFPQSSGYGGADGGRAYGYGSPGATSRDRFGSYSGGGLGGYGGRPGQGAGPAGTPGDGTEHGTGGQDSQGYGYAPLGSLNASPGSATGADGRGRAEVSGDTRRRDARQRNPLDMGTPPLYRQARPPRP